jgi:hypothetical protein
MRGNIALAVLVAIASSSHRDTFVGSIDGPTATLGVYGQLWRADGSGVPAVNMSIEARSQGSCTNSRTGVMTATTDGGGRSG